MTSHGLQTLCNGPEKPTRCKSESVTNCKWTTDGLTRVGARDPYASKKENVFVFYVSLFFLGDDVWCIRIYWEQIIHDNHDNTSDTGQCYQQTFEYLKHPLFFTLVNCARYKQKVYKSFPILSELRDFRDVDSRNLPGIANSRRCLHAAPKIYKWSQSNKFRSQTNFWLQCTICFQNPGIVKIASPPILALWRSWEQKRVNATGEMISFGG